MQCFKNAQQVSQIELWTAIPYTVLHYSVRIERMTQPLHSQ
jgi:hypothetical protein